MKSAARAGVFVVAQAHEGDRPAAEHLPAGLAEAAEQEGERDAAAFAGVGEAFEVAACQFVGAGDHDGRAGLWRRRRGG